MVGRIGSAKRVYPKRGKVTHLWVLGRCESVHSLIWGKRNGKKQKKRRQRELKRSGRGEVRVTISQGTLTLGKLLIILNVAT